MGSDKTTVTSNVTATPEENELNRLLLERTKATQDQMTDVQKQGLTLSSQLLTGTDLPGYLKGLPYGMSEPVVSNLVQNALGDVSSKANALGILDSGTAQELGVNTAADIRSQTEQFNLQNLSQLLNMAIGGQAQVQSPILTQTGMLGDQLAGLRTTTATQKSMNPFLRSFQQRAGESLATTFTGGRSGSFKYGSMGGSIGGA